MSFQAFIRRKEVVSLQETLQSIVQSLSSYVAKTRNDQDLLRTVFLGEKTTNTNLIKEIGKKFFSADVQGLESVLQKIDERLQINDDTFKELVLETTQDVLSISTVKVKISFEDDSVQIFRYNLLDFVRIIFEKTDLSLHKCNITDVDIHFPLYLLVQARGDLPKFFYDFMKKKYPVMLKNDIISSYNSIGIPDTVAKSILDVPNGIACHYNAKQLLESYVDILCGTTCASSYEIPKGLELSEAMTRQYEGASNRVDGKLVFKYWIIEQFEICCSPKIEDFIVSVLSDSASKASCKYTTRDDELLVHEVDVIVHKTSDNFIKAGVCSDASGESSEAIPFDRWFHGTASHHCEKILNEGIDLCFCKPENDFGKAFYLTQSYEHACEWARKHQNLSYPCVLVYHVPRSDLNSLSSHVWESGDADWAAFVKHCRAKSNSAKKFQRGRFKKTQWIKGPEASVNAAKVSSSNWTPKPNGSGVPQLAVREESGVDLFNKHLTRVNVLFVSSEGKGEKTNGGGKPESSGQSKKGKILKKNQKKMIR